MRRNKQIDVKRALALSTTLNLLISCACACLLPFLTLYFRQLGLTPAMTGIVMGTKHAITLIWSPAGSFLAKHYNKRRAAMMCSLLFSATVPLVLPLIPPTGPYAHVTCNVSEVTSSPTQNFEGKMLLSSIQPVTTWTGSLPNKTRMTHSETPAGNTSGPEVNKTTHHHENEKSHALTMQVNASVVGNISPAAPATSKDQQNSSSMNPLTRSPTNPQTSSSKNLLTSSSTNPQTSSSKNLQTSSSKNLQTSNSTNPHTSSYKNLQTSSSKNLQTNSTLTPGRKRRSALKQQEVKTKQEETEGGHFEFLGSLKAMDPLHQLFFLVLIIVSLWESLAAPLDWIVDGGLFEYLDFADASDRYSSAGVFGLLGAACGVGGAGLLVSQLSCLIGGQIPRSAVHFYCYAALAFIALPVATYLPIHLNRKRDKANGLVKALQLVRGSPHALLCAATTLMVGAACSIMENYLLWQMEDHGSSELHMGACLAVALLSQAAFPLMAGRVSKLLAPGRILTMAVATLALQCLYFSFLWGPWAALPAQTLSCFSTGAVWWAVQVQCEDVATPGAERSVRRIYSSLALHLGGVFGSFAGGFVVQRFGLAWLFRGAAAALTLWCICLPLLQWKAPRQRRINYSRLLAADASEASDSESEQERDWLDKAMEDDRSNNNYGRRINSTT